MILLSLCFGSPASAEPFSVRCSDGKIPFPYFATFDLDAKTGVFEASSGPILRADIRSVNDETVDFSIKGDGGRIELTFERRALRMRWPGIGADWVRPTLRHACAVVPVRTPLSLFDDKSYLADPAQLFSLQCDDLGQVYYFTFDRKSKKVLLESIQGGSLLPGDIQSDTDGTTDFTIGGPSQFELRWIERENSVTWRGKPGDSARPTKVNACRRIATRTILALPLRQ